MNIIGPTPQGLIGDSGLKQQNEPSCAVRPDNHLFVFCGFNDYRGADLPEVGDAWMGAAMTSDGGLTWTSRLVPGYPGDTPNIGEEFGADPTVIAAPGMVLYSFIASGRDDGAIGGYFLQRWPEQTKEDAAGWIPGDTRVIETGTPGKFVDKPDMKLNVRSNGETLPVTVDFASGEQRTLMMPEAELLTVYTTFTGNSEITKLMFARSHDYGATWEHAKKLSAGSHINQGASIATNGDDVMVVWRRFNRNAKYDAIMYAFSSDRGETFSKAAELHDLVGSSCPFDQGTTPVTFRTNALPVVVHDGSNFTVFFAARGYVVPTASCESGRSRIVMTRSSDGDSWTPAIAVDNTQSEGHQVIPAAYAAEGVIQLTWYDTRKDQSGLSSRFINDALNSNGTVLRRTVDIRGTQIVNGVPGVSTQLSQYKQGLPPNLSQPIPLERFNVNSRIFKQGTVPFNGDYHTVAAPLLRQDSAGNWQPNNGPSGDGSAPAFFAAWTDNRDIRGLINAGIDQATEYTPGDSSGSTAQLTPEDAVLTGDKLTANSEPDPTMVYAMCNPAEPRDRTRDQNIYFSAVYPGLLASSPTPGKRTLTPDGDLLQRAYVIYLQNTTNTSREFFVRIANQPVDGQASFRQTNLLDEIVVPIAGRSSATRTVFVSSVEERPVTHIDVVEIVGSGQTPLSSVIRLNANIQSPDIENPDYENPDIENEAFDILNVEVHNPDIENKMIAWYARSIDNPDIENGNTGIANPDFENPDIENPDWENFTIAFPDIENPDIENGNAALFDSYTDVSWTVRNEGNTTTAYNLKPFLNVDASGLESQIIVTRSYVRDSTQNCAEVKLVENQVMLNITGADVSNEFANPDIENPSLSDTSFFIEPGGSALMTLRVWGTEPDTIAASDAGLAVYSQACNSQQSDCGTTSLPQVIDDGTLFDIAPPEFTAVPQDLTGEATGPDGAIVEFVVNATDDSGSVDVSCAPESGSVFGLGTTAVHCIAVDPSQNSATAQFAITIEDTTPPALSLPEDWIVAPDQPNGIAVVDFSSDVSAADLVDGIVSVDCQPPSGSQFSGQTIVSCTASDAAGNTSAPDTFLLTVQFADDIDDKFPDSASPDFIVAGEVALLKWHFLNGLGSAVASEFANPALTIFKNDKTAGTCHNGEPVNHDDSSPVVDASGQDLSYQGENSDLSWNFEWQPGLTDLGCHDIFVKSQATEQEYGPYPIEVVLALPTS
ncbi:MAG: HYR domain-containing protein [Gammaproteobacteria bacterium]|nr:HYR domain-containing protein [Gammaproteobacteria bacterium]